jgi:glycosyltransferase involved in cell wall biosynthesis
MAPAPPAAPPRVSVIIPFLNTPDALALCLASLAPQRLDRGHAEIIVIDNGSTVPFDQVRAAWPDVRFLAEPSPGPGPARNTGVAAATAPVLAFIDADCRAAPGWLQAAVDAVEADPTTPFGGDIRIDFARPDHPTAVEAFEAVFGFRQKLYIETKQFSVTANLAVARPLFDTIGPFAGISTAEDLDWGRRAAAAGHPTRYRPAMRVFHPARPDFASLRRKWHRLVRHEWNAHAAAGRPAWRWRLRAAALVLAVPIESVRLFTSDRISGLATRLSGIGVLARIRWFRATEMHRLVGAGPEAATGFWNSAA